MKYKYQFINALRCRRCNIKKKFYSTNSKKNINIFITKSGKILCEYCIRRYEATLINFALGLEGEHSSQ